jgi:hypothetical protein
LIGLTNLKISGPPPMAPKLNQRRALFVLEKLDEILHWERTTERERETRFVELGRYVCEVLAGQYWRVDNMKSFDEFLEKKFPESRRKAYYLMAIHEQLPREEFKREVARHLTGKETEASEILYFRVYKSQLAVIEQAREMASLMLGGQKERDYCLEMICADFLAGTTLGEANAEVFSASVRRLLEFLPRPDRIELIHRLKETA